MLDILMVVAGSGAYLFTGLFVARAEYSNRVRNRTKIPPKPPRPRILLDEMMHRNGNGGYRRCAVLDGKPTCNCANREDWIELKNQWKDYEEWPLNHKHKQDSVPLIVVPLWPVYFAKSFIVKGATGIPDYSRMEEYDKILDEFNKETNKKFELG